MTTIDGEKVIDLEDVATLRRAIQIVTWLGLETFAENLRAVIESLGGVEGGNG